jgi:glycosyltransferase involved in cell wall biosynthesis
MLVYIGIMDELQNAPERPSQRVSICMAVYNGEAHIREQLDSLTTQTQLPFELVVTDDGSTDETAAIIDDFSQSAPFEVRYFRNTKRLGYADNFLFAASLCRAELIGFCDQDDVWEADKIELCAREFFDPAIMLCVHSASLFGRSIQGQHRVPDYRIRNTYRPLTYYPLIGTCGFAMVFRRKLLEIKRAADRLAVAPRTEGPLAHDQWIWFLGTVFGDTITLPRSLAFYRQHEKNASGPKMQDLAEMRRKQLTIRDYSDRSSREACAAEFLEMIAARGDGWQGYARRGAEFFRRCSAINLSRYRLHGADLSFVERVRLFVELLLSGSYRLGQVAAWLGWRALVKDLGMGVFRISFL